MRKVGFAGGQFEADVCDLLPSNEGRASIVFKMIEAYGLNNLCDYITVKSCTRDQLMKFHDKDYVDLLLRRRPALDKEAPLKLREKLLLLNKESDIDDDEEDEEDGDGKEETKQTLEQYGLLYDCPLFPMMRQYVEITAGSSISAAQYLLNSPENMISINWNGGRHHCKKSKAFGFCYVNDIVLSILELRKKFNKIMYIDLDLHHGDGVETAFKFSNNVVTFSIHRKDLGFFPGTGSIDDLGKGKGINSCFNLPIRHGLGDESLNKIVDNILLPCIDKIKPEVLVIQCGCDGLNSDEHKEWNLTIKGLGNQISKLLGLDIQTLLLGGGGYNHQQSARYWTYLTAIALDTELQFDILPDTLLSVDNSDEEGEYEFWNIQPKNMIDENDDAYIQKLTEIILDRLI